MGALIWAVFAILMVGLGYQQIDKGITLESNILKLLPEGNSDPVIEKAFKQFAEKNMQQLIFLVANSNKDKAIYFASQLAEKLGNHQRIESVTFKVSDEQQKQIGKFQFGYRHHLISENDRAQLLNGNYQYFSDEVIQQIYSPFSGGLVDLLKIDPMLLSYRFGLSQNTQSDGSSNDIQGIKLNGQYLIANEDDRSHVLVTAKLMGSPFDQQTQKDISLLLSTLEQQWQKYTTGNQQYSKPELIKTGAMFYASYGYQVARDEISTIGLGSLMLVIGLVVIAFFSIRPIILVSVALFFGISSGFTLVHIFFGHVHLLTVVFGASLIGVAVDYAFHYFSVEESSSRMTRLSQIFPAISLGLLSSVIGYLSLMTTPFPGLQQMAVFCVVGLIGAYLTVVLLFPIIKLKNHTPSFLLKFCQMILNFGATRFSTALWRLATLLPLVAAIVFFNQSLGNDDIRQFQTLNDELKNSEQTIKRVVNAPAANQFYLVKAKSADSLLVQLEKTTQHLDGLIDRGIIDDYQSISQWLPSIQQQKQTYELYQSLYQSEAFEQLLALGIVTQSDIEETTKLFANDRGNYLQAEQWLTSAVGKQMSYLWLGKIEQDYAAVISISGIHDLAALKNFDDNSVFVDKVSQVSNLFNIYRHKASQLLMIAIGLIFVILLFRYGIRKALIISSSPIIAISMTILGLVALGVSVNLFNTLALFLVLGIGIDYGLFFAEAKSTEPRTLLAVLLSALTTIFSFGLLALSQTSAIQAFGLTMLIGISTVFILSPIIGHLVTKKD